MVHEQCLDQEELGSSDTASFEITNLPDSYARYELFDGFLLQ